LVDGFRIADELRAADPEAYETLSSVEVTGHYIGDGAHLMARRPVFRHDKGRLVQVTFNNYDRAPFRLPDAEMREFYRALKAFEALANDARLQWRHPLRPGEVLLFDNWRVLHGRAAYHGERRLCGAYLNREDFESRLRILRRPTNRFGRA
jgi:trimethyllysine dioxygenase